MLAVRAKGRSFLWSLGLIEADVRAWIIRSTLKTLREVVTAVGPRCVKSFLPGKLVAFLGARCLSSELA